MTTCYGKKTRIENFHEDLRQPTKGGKQQGHRKPKAYHSEQIVQLPLHHTEIYTERKANKENI